MPGPLARLRSLFGRRGEAARAVVVSSAASEREQVPAQWNAWVDQANPKTLLGRVASTLGLARGRPRSPDIGPILRSNFLGVESGPWHRIIKADWLGPYTPTRVSFPVLKLMREDPQLALGMGALKAPFFSIEYRLRGGDPAARAFVENAFHRTPLFDRGVTAILNSLDFGFQAAELVWGLRDVVHEVEGVHKGVFENAYVLDDLNDIDPERLSSIRVDEYGRMLAATFDVAQELGAEKLLHAVHQGEFRNHWGRAQLKRAYNPFYWCNWLYLYKMRYFEQKGIPPLIGTAPPTNVFDASQDRAQQEGKDAVRLIAQQMMALRSGGAAALPWQPDASGKNMYSIAELQVSERSEQFITAINHMQGLKLRAIGIPERTMTQDTQTGSYASVSEHVDMYYQVLEVLKRTTVLPALNHLALVLTRANFKRTTSVPYFTATPLSRQGRDIVAKIIQSALGVPLTLEDGRSYTPGQLIDFEKAFEEFAVPLKKAAQVARHPVGLAPGAPGGPAAPKPPTAPSPPKPPGSPIEVSTDDQAPADAETSGLAISSELARRRDDAIAGALQATTLALETSQALAERPILVNVNVPQQAPPVVNVASSPAVVRVSPAAAVAPIVNVTTPAPVVNVSTPAPPAPARKEVSFRFGPDGLPLGASIRPE